MESYFNYLLIPLRLLASLMFLFIVYVLSQIFFSISIDKDFISTFIVSILTLLLSLYLSYRFMYLLIKQRYTFKIAADEIIVKDIFSQQIETIGYGEIRGYSKGTIKTFRAGSFEELILYCSNDRIYEIPQYAYLNFRKIKEEFKRNRKLKCLGKETINWTLKIAFKDLLFREYKFRTIEKN